MEEGSAGLKIDNPSVSVERWGLFLHNFFQLLQQMKEILVIIWRVRENATSKKHGKYRLLLKGWHDRQISLEHLLIRQML